MSDGSYVTTSAWVRTLGRPDAIDEIADQFERPTDTAVPSEIAWPRRSRGWRGSSRLHGARAAS